MTYAEEIRRQVEAAPLAALPAITAALWRGLSQTRMRLRSGIVSHP